MPTVTFALLAALLASLAWSQPSATPPCLNCKDLAEYTDFEGKRVDLVEAPAWAKVRQLAVHQGDALHLQDVEDSETTLKAQLSALRALRALPTTLDVSLFDVHMHEHPDGGVHIIFVVTRIALTAEDTPGRAMDEASTWTPLVSSGARTTGFEFLRDQRLGDTLGGNYSERFLSSSGMSFLPETSGWASATDGFYDIKTGFQLTQWQQGALSGLLCGPEFDFSELPYGATRLRNLSVSAGCSYRFRSSSLDAWRLSGRYRFSRQKLDVPGAPERGFDNHGFEADGYREFTIPNGFFRTDTWMDLAHSDVTKPSFRLGEFARFYFEALVGTSNSMTFDITGSGGAALGPLTANRAFVAGARLDPLLLEDSLSTDDHSLMGPILRGYGVGQFSVPVAPSLTTRQGTAFSGVSVTVGMPGLSQPLYQRDSHTADKLQDMEKNLTASTRALVLSRYLQSESDEQKAREKAQKRVNELKLTVHNLVRNTKLASIRPIVAFDYADLYSRSGPGIRDWSAGGGVRMWLRNGLIEVLYLRNGEAIPGLSPSNLVVRYSSHVLNSEFSRPQK